MQKQYPVNHIFKIDNFFFKRLDVGFILYQTMIDMAIFAVLLPKQGLEGEKDLAIMQGGFNITQACNFYAKKLCIIFLNLAPRHVESGFVSSDTRMS